MSKILTHSQWCDAMVEVRYHAMDEEIDRNVRLLEDSHEALRTEIERLTKERNEALEEVVRVKAAWADGVFNERAKVVAWLRSGDLWQPAGAHVDAIERGEHDR